ncbi:hypothetical protein HUJ04_006102 [Dendroctonus ponderosae]|nr:hypothetical protein HUJ04_006102 [Dendroctonus ponderosae]
MASIVVRRRLAAIFLFLAPPGASQEAPSYQHGRFIYQDYCGDLPRIALDFLGLLPATDYQFRVITQYNPQDELWLMYSLPEFLGNDSMDATSELRAPKYLHEDFTTSTSTRLSWDRVSNAKFYTVCYVPTKDERECEQGNFAKSYSPKVEVSKLQPNTEYIFKVRAHDSNSVPGGLSQPLRVRTPADVPSPVVELGFSFLNSTTVCVYWQPPAIQNGPLENYVVSYTTDPNWSLEHLLNFTVAADQRKPQSCRDNNKTGALETAQYRISKSAWLKNEEHKHIADVARRVEDMTGLSMETAEELQVVNYGIGGHYEPHFDFARKEETNAFQNLGTGNRIATVLFYMSDVVQGGATVFPMARTALWPKKGTAAFWFNLFPSGDGDKRTRHAACPVLAGSKWVSNKWIHEREQEFRRPCTTERPPEHLTA